MGTIVKRGDAHRAVVRLKGMSPQTKTFDTKAAAQDWIIETERNLKTRAGISRDFTLGGLMRKYRTEVEQKKPYGARAASQLLRWAIDWDRQELADCSAEWWVKETSAWKVSPYSRGTYVSKIRGVLVSAETLWDVTVNWDEFNRGFKKLRHANLITKGRPRDRRITDDEIEEIKTALRPSAIPMADIIDFALELGMRISEICRLTWKDLDEKKKMIWVRDRKHPTRKMGNDKQVPLLGKSLAIIKRQPRDGERIFPYVSGTISHFFMLARKIARVENVRFHDLRHEAISRLFDAGYAIEEVALVSGHDSWSSLKRYTHVKPERLHQGPISRRRAA